MKKNQFHKLLSLVIILFFGCEEQEQLSVTIPEISKLEVTDNGSLTFTLQAMLPSDDMLVSECGFYCSENASMQVTEKYFSRLTGSTFASEITLKGYNRKYYVCAFVSNGRTEILSEVKMISVASLANYVSLGQVNLLSYNRNTETARFNLTASFKQGVEVTNLGIQYGMVSGIESENRTKSLTYKEGNAIEFELSNLKIGSMYFFRPFIMSCGYVGYGQKTTWTACSHPTVTTGRISEITSVSAKISGKVTDDGGALVTSRGIVWSTSPNPTISLPTKIVDEGAGAGDFLCAISNLDRATKYYVRAYATNLAGTSYGELKSFTTSAEPYDISLSGTSNCYIVSQTGIYKFKTVKGNSHTSVGSVSSCEVLWESFGTETAPSKGELIKSVSYCDGYITFEIPITYKKGNAVIAAKDSKGNILWSWHIWLTDEPQEQIYYNNAGSMMDRNLGATSAVSGDIGAIGLLYQWGRKDPFLGSANINSEVEAQSTLPWPVAVESTSSIGTVAYSIAHPTTFIKCNVNNFDWYYSYDDNTDNSRWQSVKTIYDPCPSGWRVPNSSEKGVWSKAVGSSTLFFYSYDSARNGMDFSYKFGSSSLIWYPASGYRYFTSGNIVDVGECGHWWSVTTDDCGKYAGYLYILSSGCVYSLLHIARANGLSVRCLKE